MVTSPTSPTAELREMVLNLTPEKAQISVPETGSGVWGVVMDTAFDDGGGYTTVALIDGNASVYIGDQSAVIGGFAHPSVRRAAKAAVTVAEDFAPHCRPAEILPLLQPGHTRFYLLTRDGRVVSAEVLEEDLGEGRHFLSPLFYAMHEVITELRFIAEQQEPGWAVP